MYLRISYNHDTRSPTFPGNPTNQVRPVLAFSAGDSCNAAEVCLFNHNGTHADFPNHYHEQGRRVVDYDLAELVFERPALVSIEAGVGEPITPKQLRSAAGALEGSDFLLLRTGFGARRGSPEYTNNPYLSLDAAHFLRGFRRLRGLGMDFLSVTNARLRPLGDEVHRILLAESPDARAILLVEDLDLSVPEVIERFHRLFVVPIFMEGVDGMPCTVFGEYEA